MPFDAVIVIAAFSVLFAAAFFFASFPLMGILQQEGYSPRAFLRWFFKRRNVVRQRYGLLATAFLFLGGIFAVAFSFLGATAAVCASLLACIALCAVFCYAFRAALKVPLVFTRRMIRLGVAYAVCIGLVCAGAQCGLWFCAEAVGGRIAHALLRTLPLAVLPLLLPLVLCAANLIMQTYEVPRSRALLRRAARLLRESDCVKIGITGSFGKTSVKEYARVLLGDGAYATPASYNTPLGIARCVNEHGLNCRYFLAEMGARKAGDIAELCDLVSPEYGVVTGICPQHIQTFGSLEAIKREKGVLARRAKTVVAGRTAADLSEDAFAEGRDFACENIELTKAGSSFDLVIAGERARVHTALLGRHAAEDVAIAAALCYRLGMPFEQIAARIPLLTPVPHRLQRLDGNGADVLDDSYNANIEGAKNAAEVLSLFGGRRFVVTPGIVELGELEEDINFELGKLLAPFELILVGETLVLPVKRGYLAAGGSAVSVVPTLSAARDLLSERLGAGDCVLFLNDLPDKYL